MKKLIVLMIFFAGASTQFAQNEKGKIRESKSDTTAHFLYTCPMHPEVITDKAGKCPKCGMDLVKKKADKIYTCVMHPDVLSDKPGKCPKCGMDMVEKNQHLNQKQQHNDNPGRNSVF
ncbi:MAG TPA: heavy metal-binding domain-containing protein [Puia sp.]|jgi:transcription initiation factor IIE alpha subunit|nr:heavy metal-binding domain-containing protein [Puia sp.]